MGKSADRFVEHNAAMVEDFLELAYSSAAHMRGQICFPRAHRRDIERERQYRCPVYTARKEWRPESPQFP
jgi:hypothetical protein